MSKKVGVFEVSDGTEMSDLVESYENLFGEDTCTAEEQHKLFLIVGVFGIERVRSVMLKLTINGLRPLQGTQKRNPCGLIAAMCENGRSK